MARQLPRPWIKEALRPLSTQESSVIHIPALKQRAQIVHFSTFRDQEHPNVHICGEISDKFNIIRCFFSNECTDTYERENGRSLTSIKGALIALLDVQFDTHTEGHDRTISCHIQINSFTLVGSIGEPPFGQPVYVLDDPEIRAWLERHRESQLIKQAIDHSQIFSQLDSLPYSSSSGITPSLAPAIELQSPPQSRKRKRREIDATNSHPGWRGLYEITDEMCRIPREQQHTLDKMDQWRPLVPPGFTPRMFVDGPINSSVTNTPVREARIRARSSATPSANSTPSAQRYIQNTPSNKPSKPVFVSPSPSQPNLSVSKDPAATSTGSVVSASQALHNSAESQLNEPSTQAPQQSSVESQILFTQGPQQSSNELQIPFTQAPLQYQQFNNQSQMPTSQISQHFSNESQMPFSQMQADVSLNSPDRSVPAAQGSPPRIASTASSPLPPTSDTSYYDPLTHAFEMGYSSLNMHTQYDGGFAPDNDVDEVSPASIQGSYPLLQESQASDFGTQYVHEMHVDPSEEETKHAEEIHGDFTNENEDESHQEEGVQDELSIETPAGTTSEHPVMLPVGEVVQANEVEEVSVDDSREGDQGIEEMDEDQHDNSNVRQMETTEYMPVLPVIDSAGLSYQSFGNATPRSGFVAQTQTPISRLQPFFDFSSQMTSFPETQHAEAQLNFADDMAEMIETSASAPELSMSNPLEGSANNIAPKNMEPDVSMSNIIDDSEQQIVSKDIENAKEDVESVSAVEAPKDNATRSIPEILVPKLAAEHRPQVIDMPMPSLPEASSGSLYEESQHGNFSSEMSSMTELTQQTSDVQPSQASQMMSTQGTIVIEPESEPESESESISELEPEVLELSSDEGDEELLSNEEDAEASDSPVIDHLEDSQLSDNDMSVARTHTARSIIPFTAARRRSASLTHPSSLIENEISGAKLNNNTDIVSSSLPEEHDFPLLSSSLPESESKETAQPEIETSEEVERIVPDEQPAVIEREDAPRLLESVTLQPSRTSTHRVDSEEIIKEKSSEVSMKDASVVANDSANKSDAPPSTPVAKVPPATPRTPENASPATSRTPSGRPLMEGRTPRSPLVELPIPLKESSVPGVNGLKRRSLPDTFFTTYKSPKTKKLRLSMTPQKAPRTVFVMAALEEPPSNATQVKDLTGLTGDTMPIDKPQKGLLLPEIDVSYKACIANLLRVAEKGAFGQSWKAVWQKKVTSSPKVSSTMPERDSSKDASSPLSPFRSPRDQQAIHTAREEPAPEPEPEPEPSLDPNLRKQYAPALSEPAKDVSEPKVIRLIERTRSPADRRRTSLKKLGVGDTTERDSEPSVERRSEQPLESQSGASAESQSEQLSESQSGPPVGSQFEQPVESKAEQSVRSLEEQEAKRQKLPLRTRTATTSSTASPKRKSSTATRKRSRSNGLESTTARGDVSKVGHGRRVTRSALRGADSGEGGDGGDGGERPTKAAKRDMSTRSVTSGDQSASGQQVVRHLMVHGRKGARGRYGGVRR